MPKKETIIDIYNKQMQGIEDKFVPHFSTWLSQRRWEMEEIDQIKAMLNDARKELASYKCPTAQEIESNNAKAKK